MLRLNNVSFLVFYFSYALQFLFFGVMLMVLHWHELELCLCVGFIFGSILRIKSVVLDIQDYNMKIYFRLSSRCFPCQ